MANLFALCRAVDRLEVKRVALSRPVQAKVAAIFEGQAQAFLKGVDEEVAFGSEWKPDEEQILVMDTPNEAAAVAHNLTNPLALPPLTANGMTQIVALAMYVGNDGAARLLVQRFTLQQVLSRKALTLMLSGETFNELTDAAFTLANGLAAIIEGGKLKFKNFSAVKRIFSLKEYYQAATDQQIETFCAHDSLSVSDVEAFKRISDQTMRGLVHALTKTNVLSHYPAGDIASKAKSLTQKSTAWRAA